MTTELLHILQHSLGVDKFGQGNQYRNHFATGPGSDDWDKCLALAASGHMKDHGPQQMWGGMHGFTVTPKGIDAVALESPAPPEPPKLTRSQKRYREWLHADTGHSFKEWIGAK